MPNPQEGSPSNPVLLDPWQNIVDCHFGVTGGGSGSTSSDAHPTLGSFGPMTHMGSSATGAATADGTGHVTLPNNGTYSISLAGTGAGGSGGSLVIGMQDGGGAILAQSPPQSGSGTLNVSYGTTITAPGGVHGTGTFTIETVYLLTGDSGSAVMISILGTITKTS